MEGYAGGGISLHIIKRLKFLPPLHFHCWMIIIGSSFVLDRLHWTDSHKFLGLCRPLLLLILF